jgi:hypothetical protein
MQKVFIALIFLCLHVFGFDLNSAANALLSSDNTEKTQTNFSLIKTLTSNLGVSNSQALGGTSAILSKAASNMSSAEVTSLTSAIPSLSSLLSTSESKSSSVLGSLVSSSSLSSKFQALGMDSSMVGKFTAVILEFINSNAGKAVMQSVQNALK